MFTCRPVAVTSHLIVFISVFRRSKCCNPRQYVYCVLLPYSTSYIYYQLVASWCSSDDNACCVPDQGLLLSNSSFLPSVMSYINTPDIFLYPLLVFKRPGELFMHGFPLKFFYFLVFNSGLKLILHNILLAFSCFIYFSLDQLIVAGNIWLYRSNILALIRLSYFMYVIERRSLQLTELLVNTR